MACAKRRFSSEQTAKAAHRRAGYRLRVYRCDECRGYHTTNVDKNGPMQPYGAPHRRKGAHLKLAPVMTLEELEAAAAAKRAKYAG